MDNMRRKDFDTLVDESEDLQLRWQAVAALPADDPERARLLQAAVALVTDWAAQGRFIPLGSPERRALRSTLDHWAARLREAGQLHEGMQTLAAFDPQAGVVLDVPCPYPGLLPYAQSDRGRFFGREALVEQIRSHLEGPEGAGNRILLIVGSSGAGKSSLALAGVLPQLVERHAADWLFAERMTPGSQPLAALAAVVAAAVGRPELASALQRDLATAPSQAAAQFAAACRGRPLLLLIDQFEELLTLCRDATEQAAFAQALVSLSAADAAPDGFACRTLLTLRTDYLDRFGSRDALKPLNVRLVDERNFVYMTSIGFIDIRRAIQQPADAVGLRFVPPTLVDSLASQTAGLANGLPLLQFALRRLWAERPRDASGRPLDLVTQAMVDRLPDVQQALGTVAGQLFQAFSDTQRALCERLLQELVVLDDNFDEPLRRRRHEGRLVQVLRTQFPDPADTGRVIGDFIAAELLRRFGDAPDTRLEVAHEALLRHWGHIHDILTGADVKERLHAIKQIDAESRKWEEKARSDDYLTLRGERLRLAAEYAAAGWLGNPAASAAGASGAAESLSLAFVTACELRESAEKQRDIDYQRSERQAQEDREKAAAVKLKSERLRRRVWLSGLTALLVLMIIGFFLGQSEQKSLDQELTISALVQTDPQSGLLLALEAARHGGIALPGVERALRGALRADGVLAQVEGYGGARIVSTALSPDGRLLVTGDSIGGVAFRDIDSGAQRDRNGAQRLAQYEHVGPVNALAFSPDGEWLASAGNEGRVVLWNLRSRQRAHVIPAHGGSVGGLAFSRPDGRWLATAGADDGVIRLWDTRTGKAVRSLQGHFGGVKAVAFGRDQRQLVSAGADNRVVHWDAVDGKALYAQVFDNVSDLDLSADGARLAIAGTGVTVWDSGTRARVLELSGHRAIVLNARFSGDRRRLVTCSYDGTVRLWRLPKDDDRSDQTAVEMERFTALARVLTFSNLAVDGRAEVIAAIGLAKETSSVTVWGRARGGELRAWTADDQAIRELAFAPGGQSLLVANDDGAFSQWSLAAEQGKTIPDGLSATSKVGAAASSRSGVVAVADGADILVWPAPGKPALRLRGHAKLVTRLAINPDGTRLLSASNLEPRAIAWELPAGRRLADLSGGGEEQKNAIGALAVSPDGRVAALSLTGGTIRLFSVDSGKLLEQQFAQDPQKNRDEMHVLDVADMAFSTDGRLLFSAGMDKAVGVWDLERRSLIEFLHGHQESVNALAVDGRVLASASDDGIRLWDIATRSVVPAFSAGTIGARRMAFSADGRQLAAGAADGAIRIYLMQPGDLVAAAKGRVRRAWTAAECQQQQLGGLFRRCPQSHFDLLAAADRAFADDRFDDGERLLLEARADRSQADVEREVEARVHARVMLAATAEAQRLVQPAASASSPQRSWADLKADFKKALTTVDVDPDKRVDELNAYMAIDEVGRLAAEGDPAVVATAYAQAQTMGWALPEPPQRLADRLVAVAASEKVFAAAAAEKPLRPDDAARMTKQLEAGIAADPQMAPAHWAMGLLAKDAGQPLAAREHLVRAAELLQSGEPLVDLASLLIDSDPKDAARWANDALQMDSRLDLAWMALGLAKFHSGNWNAAVRAFDNVAQTSASFADANNSAAGIAFEHLGDNAGARRRLDRALQAKPDDVAIISNYAELLLATRQAEAAITLADRVLRRTAAGAPELGNIRPAMAFVKFAAALLKPDGRDEAARTLAEMDALIKANPPYKPDDGWSFKGIRAIVSRGWAGNPPGQKAAMLAVLDYVESNGAKGSLGPMQAWLTAHPLR